MDGKTLARIGAIVFVALAITATAIEMDRPTTRTMARRLAAGRVDRARSARGNSHDAAASAKPAARDPVLPARMGGEPPPVSRPARRALARLRRRRRGPSCADPQSS